MMEDVGGDSSDFLGEFSKGIFHAHFMPDKIQVLKLKSFAKR